MKLGMTPKYTHDCTKCRYLGSMFMAHDVADWYVCEGSDPSVIARYGNDGPNYWSMPKGMVTDDRYLTARRSNDDTMGFSHMQVLAQFMLKQGTTHMRSCATSKTGDENKCDCKDWGMT